MQLKKEILGYMKNKNLKLMKKIKLLVLCIILSNLIIAQNNVSADGIIAVIGQEMVVRSEIESQILQYKARNINLSDDMRCFVFEELLYSTLLVNQAAIDSIEVGKSRIESQLENRLNMFEEQMNGREEMEKYFGKPYLQIKNYFRPIIKNQILAQQMQSEITKDVKISPTEVKLFYRKFPKDSLPLVESEIEVSQIVIYPEMKQEQIDKVKRDLENYRKRVQDGEDFSMLATLYSEDQASAEQGGSLNWIRRNTLVPEFASVAFSMTEEGEVSDVFESEFGYHIIQFLGRRGERINIKHILLKPKILPSAKSKARKKLDSIANAIRNNEIKFQEAAKMYSQDEETLRSGGILINPYTGTSKFESKHFAAATNYVIKQLKIGEISDSYESVDRKGKTELKIIQLDSKTEAHVSSLETDYQIISDLALQQKQQESANEWIMETQKTTYIRIVPEYRKCNFKYKGWLKY